MIDLQTKMQDPDYYNKDIPVNARKNPKRALSRAV